MRTDASQPDRGAFHGPLWLPGRHLQTIYAAQFAPRARVSYRRERWDTADGDFIDLDFTAPAAPANAPVLVLFHGLEGCSLSHYAVAMMSAAQARGWQGIVAHFRGCSGEMNLTPRAYHSGDSDEIDFVLRRIATRFEHSARFAAGVSLGANALLKWLGTNGHNAGAVIERAATVSAPHDLQAGAQALSHGFSRVYTWNFLRTLKRKSNAKLEQFPGLFDSVRMNNATTFFEFDDAVTAPLHGFASCYDYWTRSSSRQFMAGIEVPTLVLNALNDPFVPRDSLARPDQVSASVTLDYPATGGHVGFVSGHFPGSLQWLSQHLLNWIDVKNDG